ncbi:MAG: hypothetical protein FJX29_04150 [Alphaproteobacteria bacterium]|nr:hypothetical protein [Alphaproteobacteria bacterium]
MRPVFKALLAGAAIFACVTTLRAQTPPPAAAAKPQTKPQIKPATKPPVKPPQEAVTLVRNLYDKAPGTISGPFSQRLAKLRDAAQANAKQIGAPVAGLDFAFELNAPDGEAGYMKTLRVTPVSGDGKRARVRVVLRNYRPVELWFDLVFENKTWLIDEVHSRREPRWSLSGLYAAGAKEK